MIEAHDKTEAPTLRRRAEARRKGQIARSADLASAAVLLAAVTMMQTTGPKLVAPLRWLMEQAFSQPAVPFTRAELLGVAALIAQAMTPFLGVVLVVAAIANFLQVGPFFRFRLNDEAFDIAKGFQRLFSPRSRARLLLDLVKLVAVTWVAYVLVRQSFDRIVGLSELDAVSSLAAGMMIVLGIALRIVLLLLVLGLLDYAYQRWQHERDLRMTRREVKDELREMEGDPHSKRNRRRFAASLVSSRLERKISFANVLITHENQLAVAIRYDQGTMDAPQIIAKGAGATVARLREAAAGAGVAIIEEEPLARALSRLIDIGGDIPQHLYSAVAQVLAYAAAAKTGGPSR